MQIDFLSISFQILSDFSYSPNNFFFLFCSVDPFESNLLKRKICCSKMCWVCKYVSYCEWFLCVFDWNSFLLFDVLVHEILFWFKKNVIDPWCPAQGILTFVSFKCNDYWRDFLFTFSINRKIKLKYCLQFQIVCVCNWELEGVTILNQQILPTAKKNCCLSSFVISIAMQCRK